MDDRHKGQAAAVEAADATLRSVIADAYNRGFADGATDVRTKLAHFLERGEQHIFAPRVTDAPKKDAAHAASGKRIPRRAIREGSIPDFLRRSLPNIHDATPTGIREAASQQGKEFSVDAIRTELVRWRDVRYRRSADGKWFLIGSAEKEAAGDARKGSPADAETPTNGGTHGSALAE